MLDEIASANNHCYFNYIFHELKVPKESITTETFHINHYKLIQFL